MASLCCCLFSFFRAAPSSVAAIRLNHSASPVQEVSPMGCCLAQIVAILLVCFAFIPYSCYMVGYSLYLHLRRLSPFPAFSSRNNVGDSSRENRETALMRCIHHLRAASGERSNLQVGLAATTPLFEEETYRKVCRMGRDVPFSAKMNHAHLHQEGILGHPF